MSKEPNWLDILLDPGILERRRKAEHVRHTVLLALAILKPLRAALKGGMDIEEAIDSTIESFKTAGDEMVRDLEAIDKPMPEGL